MKKSVIKFALSLCISFVCLFSVTAIQTCQAKAEVLPAQVISSENGITKLASSDGIEWPGSTATSFLDSSSMFTKEASGLDFHNGKLYVVENGDGIIWVLDVAKSGAVSYASGYNKDGKETKFKSNSSSSKGIDAEGITVDGDGWVYVCTERDLADKDTNKNAVVKIDANSSSSTLVGVEEWDLTSAIPKPSDTNKGLEAVEWVPNSEVEGKLYDTNRKGLFSSSNYPKQTSNGVFFVALENNGHVYGFVFNNDGTFVLIADINPGLGCAMALDYDVYQDVLWVVTDNNGDNVSAQVVFNGTQTPSFTKVKPVSTLDDGKNYEGFAIATEDYSIDSEKFVFNIEDGASSKALLFGKIKIDYMNATSSGGGDSNINQGGNVNSASGGNSSSNVQNSSSVAQNSSSNAANNNSHSYSSVWHANNSEHYYDCSCGQKHNAENHQIIVVNQKEATKRDEGYTGDKVCAICNYTVEKGEVIDKLPNNGNGVILYVAIASVGVLGLVALTLFLIKKFKK